MDAEQRKADVMKNAHEILLKCVDVVEKNLLDDMSMEEGVNSSCYIGLGIITANFMVNCETSEERRQMASILIGHCIETIQNSVNTLDALMPERTSKIILPH